MADLKKSEGDMYLKVVLSIIAIELALISLVLLDGSLALYF